MKYFGPLVLLSCLVLRGGAAENYCSPKAPLHTEYVQSTYEETRPVSGCISSQRDSNDNQVVVIRTNTSAEEVVLTLTGNYISLNYCFANSDLNLHILQQILDQREFYSSSTHLETSNGD